MMINKKLAKMMTEKPIKSDVTVKENKLYLYGTVGDDWDGITLDDVKNLTNQMNSDSVTIYINSYGGDATEGVAIRNFLRSTFKTIDVVIDGIAASAASVIATCGDTLSMPNGTTFMIHNPWTFFVGNRQDLIREEKTLASLEQSYRNIYMERFTGTEDELTQLMDDESWLTAGEAKQLGFADEESIEEDDIEPEESENSPLVATLLNKYVAQTKDIHESAETTTNTENTEPKKENQFLNNFTKAFSQIQKGAK